MVQAQDKRLMAPLVCMYFYPFAERLQEWEVLVQVDCGLPWAWATAVEAVVEKGAQKLATSKESTALVVENIAYQVEASYAQVIT